MKRTLFLILFITLISFLFAPFAFAKGSPDKIIIWGPTLAQPIEITNPETLNGFDPWDGQFLDRRVSTISEEPDVQQIYNIIFYLRNNKGELRVFYVFQYAPNPFGGRGFIYLPRAGEPWHRVNEQTIIRSSGWQRASAEWDTLMKQALGIDRVNQRLSR